MENMDMGLTVPKWVLIVRPKMPQNWTNWADKFNLSVQAQSSQSDSISKGQLI